MALVSARQRLHPMSPRAQHRFQLRIAAGSNPLNFVPPIRTQMAALAQVADVEGLRRFGRWRDLSPDLIEAILEGVGQLAAEQWMPIARAGDRIGALHSGGAVEMPPGFCDAYAAFVEGGWAGI